jgi:hypothetical protein
MMNRLVLYVIILLSLTAPQNERVVTGGEDAKLNVWACPTPNTDHDDNAMEVDSPPSKKRDMDWEEENVRFAAASTNPELILLSREESEQENDGIFCSPAYLPIQKSLNSASSTSSTSIRPETFPTALAAYLSSSAPRTMSSAAKKV